MNLQADIPLTEATFFILLSLAPEPKHGYAIMKEVRALSDGRVILSTGTLYGAIKRLLDWGWIVRQEEITQDKADGHGSSRERKVYALTDDGRRVLKAEVMRLRKLVRVAQAVR